MMTEIAKKCVEIPWGSTLLKKVTICWTENYLSRLGYDWSRILSMGHILFQYCRSKPCKSCPVLLYILEVKIFRQQRKRVIKIKYSQWFFFLIWNQLECMICIWKTILCNKTSFRSFYILSPYQIYLRNILPVYFTLTLLQ